MKVSNCCGASICEETDICCKCKEHCEVVYESMTKTELQKAFKDYLVENLSFSVSQDYPKYVTVNVLLDKDCITYFEIDLNV